MAKRSAFEDFFADEFQRDLEAVRIPAAALSMPSTGEASWDRKAAWLLYSARYGGEVVALYEPAKKPWEEDDL